MDKTELFERMPIRAAVRRQMIPAVFSQMITLIYNLADTYFVGLLNKPAESAAVAVAAPVFLMLTAISNLFGIGGASTFAASLGRKENEKASHISAAAFWFGLMSSVVFSACALVFMRPILTVCGATEETYELVRGYVMWTVVIGGPGTVLNILLANLVRAEGSAGLASAGVSAGGVLNILLDPLFVLPRFLGMGVIGAGLATAISNLAAASFFLIVLLRRRGRTALSVKPSHLKHAKEVLPSVLRVGFPSAVQYALTVAAAAAMTKFVSKYDTAAVAGFGITKKIDQLPLFFSIGTANGLLPLLAYNYAAGNIERQRQAFRYGCAIAVGFSVICLIVYEIFAPNIASVFIGDPPTIRYAASFLRRMVVAMPMVAVNYPMIIQFQAMGKVKESLVCSVLRKGVLDIPLLFLMDSIRPLYGLMWVQPTVDLISLLVSVWFFIRLGREKAKAALPE
ncbi:MAG: MATE family efflux transporter [Clostridia bacterium]|nr:MATE family efflux transporter [Clostridia bacterium]